MADAVMIICEQLAGGTMRVPLHSACCAMLCLHPESETKRLERSGISQRLIWEVVDNVNDYEP